VTVTNTAVTIRRKVLDPLVTRILAKAILGKESTSVYITLVLSDHAYIKVGNARLSRAKRLIRLAKSRRVAISSEVARILSEGKNAPVEKIERKLFDLVSERLGVDMSEAVKLLL